MLLKALRAACADLAGDPPRGRFRGNAGGRGNARRGRGRAGRLPAPVVRTSSDLADGLVAVAESFLAGKVAGADDAEVYQVVVHAGTDVLAGPAAPAAGPAGVSAETPPAPARVPGDPADPARCHVEDGPAISVSTAQMLACTAALSWMRTATAARCWPWAGAAAAPAPRSAAPPANGTTAGAGSRAASPAGSTCTTSSTGSTAAAPTWTT